jgi:hypothetical protein
MPGFASAELCYRTAMDHVEHVLIVAHKHADPDRLASM